MDAINELLGQENFDRTELTRLLKEKDDNHNSTLQLSNAKFEEIRLDRDKLKGSIRHEFGVDTMAEARDMFKKVGDLKIEDGVPNEKDIVIQQLQAEIEANKVSMSETAQQHIIDSELNKVMGQLDLVNNPYLKKTFQETLMKDVRVSDGVLVPTESIGGVTIPKMVNGRQSSLLEKAQDMSKQDEFNVFFQPHKAKTSIGHTGSGQITKKVSKMTIDEQFEYYNNK